MANAMAFYPTANGADGSGATQTIAASTTSATVAIIEPLTGSCLRIFNAGAGIAFCRWGVGAQTAVVTDFPIAPNSVEVIRIPDTATDFGAILSAGTQNVYITKGEGV